MKQIPIYDKQVHRFLATAVNTACEYWGCYPSEMYARKKTEKACKARRCVTYSLQKHIEMYGRTFYVCEMAGNNRLSGTRTAGLLNVDHSALIHPLKSLLTEDLDRVDAIIWEAWLEELPKVQTAKASPATVCQLPVQSA